MALLAVLSSASWPQRATTTPSLCAPRAETPADTAARKVLADALTMKGSGVRAVPNKFDDDWIKKNGLAFGDALRLLATACDRTAITEMLVPLASNDYRLGFQRSPKSRELAQAWAIEYWRVHALNFGPETRLGQTAVLDQLLGCMQTGSPCGMKVDTRHYAALDAYRKARGYGGDPNVARPALIPERPPASAVQWAYSVAGLGPAPTRVAMLGDALDLMLPQTDVHREVFRALAVADPGMIPAGVPDPRTIASNRAADDKLIASMLKARDEKRVHDLGWQQARTDGIANGFRYVEAIETLAVRGDAFGMAEFARLWSSYDWQGYVPVRDAPKRLKYSQAWAAAYWLRHGLKDDFATAQIGGILSRCYGDNQCGVRESVVKPGEYAEGSALHQWWLNFGSKTPSPFPASVPSRAPHTVRDWLKWQANLTPAPASLTWDPEVLIARRGPDGLGEARVGAKATPRSMTVAEKSAFDAAVQLAAHGKFAAAAAGFRPLSDAGVAQAQRSLALLMKAGAGVAKDDAGALALIRRAADAGDGEAIYFMGEHFTISGDPHAAHPWYVVAASKGVPRANLAVFYSFARGYGNGLEDIHSGRSNLAVAADGGDPVAAGELGRILAYDSRNGDKAGLETAIRYLRISADAGNAIALGTLGDIYAGEGYSGVYDLDKAAAAYRVTGNTAKLEAVRKKGARDAANAEIAREAEERRDRYIAGLRYQAAQDKGWASSSFSWKGQPPLAPLAAQPSELAQYRAISNYYNAVSCNAGWSRC